MKTQITVDLDITSTIIIGLLVILTGVISLFTIKDAGFATTCIVTGAGLCGLAKVSNTYYDTHDKPTA